MQFNQNVAFSQMWHSHNSHKEHNRVQPTFLTINDSLTTNKKNAEELNIFFGTMAQKIDQKTPKSNKHSSNYFIK